MNKAAVRDAIPIQFLYRVSRELSSGLDLRLVLQRVLLLAMQNTGAVSASIMVLDEKLHPIDSIIIHHAHIIEATTEQMKEVLDKGLAGWVLNNRQAVWISDTSSDARWLPRSDYQSSIESSAKSAIGAPLIAHGQVVGVMTLVHPQPHCFSQNQVELTQAIADQAGIAVLNARLYAESQRQIKEIERVHERYRELQNNFTAMIYHDIRSPLANINNSLSLLSSMFSVEDEPSMTPIVAIAQRAAARIQRLTSSLLDLSRLEAGQMLVKQQVIDTKFIIRDAVDAVLPTAKEKGQHIELDLPEYLPAIMVDGDMILRVLINLIENASKYSANYQPITVGAKEEFYNLHAKEEGQGQNTRWVQFWVKDNGVGLSPEEQERVFEKFTRLERHQGRAAGYGLGLAFCRLAVEAHGGCIWVESQLNHGARFALRLPCAAEKL